MHNFSRNKKSESYLQTNCPPAQARWDSNELRLPEKAKGWMSPEIIKKRRSWWTPYQVGIPPEISVLTCGSVRPYPTTFLLAGSRRCLKKDLSWPNAKNRNKTKVGPYLDSETKTPRSLELCSSSCSMLPTWKLAVLECIRKCWWLSRNERTWLHTVSRKLVISISWSSSSQ